MMRCRSHALECVAFTALVASAVGAQAPPGSHPTLYLPNTALAIHMPKSVCTKTARVGTRMVSDVQLLYPDEHQYPPFPRGSTALLEVAAVLPIPVLIRS
jgi:hypothetical protein